MAEEPRNIKKLRAWAASLHTRANTQFHDIQRVLGTEVEGSPLQGRLTAAAAHMSIVEAELFRALGAPAFLLRTTDLMTFEDIVRSSEIGVLDAHRIAPAHGTPASISEA